MTNKELEVIVCNAIDARKEPPRWLWTGFSGNPPKTQSWLFNRWLVCTKTDAN